LKVDYKDWGAIYESTDNQDYDGIIPSAGG